MEQAYRAICGRAVIGVVLLAAGIAAGQQAPGRDPATNPQEFVRQMVQNELKSGRKQHFMYRLNKVKPDGSEVRQLLETDGLLLSRIVQVNGKPLTREEAAKEDRRLQRLLDNREDLAEKQKDQREEDQRVRKMVEALPDAFVYEFAGRQAGPNGEVVILKFKPNPKFEPPNRESQVYRGMEGTMQVAMPAIRLSRIDATLVRDVSFGWGILGKLDKGGRFQVDQAPVGDGHWRTTRMVLNFTGKALLFKTLKIRLDQAATDFERVPDMGVNEGIQLLKKLDSAVASNRDRTR